MECRVWGLRYRTSLFERVGVSILFGPRQEYKTCVQLFFDIYDGGGITVTLWYRHGIRYNRRDYVKYNTIVPTRA